MSLDSTLAKIKPLDEKAMEKAQARLDDLTKPFGALGVLEAVAKQIAGITGNPLPKLGEKCVAVMAGDHGVAAEGVSMASSEVTYQMIVNFLHGGAGINVLSRFENAQAVVVDVGVATDVDLPGVISKKVRKGTDNMFVGPAMTREDAIKSIEVGIEVAEELIGKGITVLGTGEIGIGNTTPSTAIVAAYTGVDPAGITGKGTGITDEALLRKIEVISTALKVNAPDTSDPLDVLAKVGGLELGAMAGLILGGAANHVPVVIDGFISSASAIIACKLKPEAVKYIIPSHSSMEPGHKLALEYLGLKPMLLLEMRLGEGTGAAIGMNLVEAATKIINEMATFSEAGVNENVN